MSQSLQLKETQFSEELAAPFYLKSGKTGVLLIHGFTSTPYIFREIAAQLKKDGFTTYAPLVAGHGTNPDDLAQTTWQDWCASMETAYEALSKECDEIFVLGASFGANLAFHLAAHHKMKSKIKGLILIGTPRWIYRHLLAIFFTPILSLFQVKYFNKAMSKTIVDGSLLGGPTHSYLKIPIVSVENFFTFIGQITDSKTLEQIKIPALMIQSTNDGLIKPESGRYVYNHLGSKDKQLIWVNDRHDQLHLGKNRIQVYNYIKDFIERWQ